MGAVALFVILTLKEHMANYVKTLFMFTTLKNYTLSVKNLNWPIHDLRPVCPNCHAMLHKRNPAYSIEELKGFLTIK